VTGSQRVVGVKGPRVIAGGSAAVKEEGIKTDLRKGLFSFIRRLTLGHRHVRNKLLRLIPTYVVRIRLYSTSQSDFLQSTRKLSIILQNSRSRRTAPPASACNRQL